MAYYFTLPFHAFRLRFPAKEDIVIKPLAEADVVRVGQSLEALAEQFREALQYKVLNEGYMSPILDLAHFTDFQQDSLEVHFPAALDGFSYPEFSLDMDYFYTQQHGHWWGIVPVTGVEASADTPGLLRKILSDNTRIYFTRTRRLTALQGVVSAVWFEGVELLKRDIGFSGPTPTEVERMQQEKKALLLQNAAAELLVERSELFGMEAELEQVLRAMDNTFGRSILLVGPNGSGKSALISNAALKWKKAGRVGKIWETTASLLIKELTRETGWQHNLGLICRELTQTGDWLYVRSLMELFEVGRYIGNDVSIGEFLRHYLSRGEIALIGECTPEELQLIEVMSPNYASFFSVVKVNPPESKALELIVGRKSEMLAGDRRIRIAPEAVREAIALHHRFNPYSGMPGKVIRFLEAVIKEPAAGRTTITKAEITRRFCEESGIPAMMVDDGVPFDMEYALDKFRNNVFGQENAVELTLSMLVKDKVRLSRPRKPIASFLFVGPTGVGKTELAKVLAEFVFGDRNRINRFDMSEYSGYDALLRLTGAGNADGLLTSAVRREPFSVLLFDEIEKANPAFLSLLLQILDSGRLTDNKGRLVNFCSTIIIMTSNIGASTLKRPPIGMTSRSSPSDLKDHYKSAVEKEFPPELVNRFDEIIPFNALDSVSIRHVVDREVGLLRSREGIRYRRMTLKLDTAVLDFLGEKGFDPQYGARYLQRAMRERLVLPLSKALNAEDADDELNVHIKLDPVTREPVIHAEADPLSLELLIETLQEANMANLASQYRRQAQGLEDGYLFREIASNWYLLEDQRKRAGSDFWSDSRNAASYTKLGRLIERQKQAVEDIERIENEAVLSFLGEQPAEAHLQQSLATWMKAYEDFQKELLAAVRPEYNKCLFCLCGQDMAPLVRFYLGLFKAHDIHYTAKGIWLRDAYYNEEITVDLDDPAESAIRKKREAYLYEPVRDPKHPLLDRPARDDHLVGLLFELSAPLVFVKMLGEGGFQQWVFPESKPCKYFVGVSTPLDTAQPAPPGVHRRNFFKSNPRRTVTLDMQRDTAYDIEHKGDLEGFMDLVSEKWEQRLADEIRAALV